MNDFLKHLPPTAIAAALAWVAYELRAWRLWWMNQHGGAPDAAERQNEH